MSEDEFENVENESGWEPDEDQELYEHVRIVSEKGQVLLRIDKFLQNRLEHTSRSRLQNAAAAGNIHVNGKPVNPISYCLDGLSVQEYKELVTLAGQVVQSLD